MGDDARDGVAAAVVVAEDLAEEAPDGGDRAEQAVAVLDAVLVEDVEDAGLGQGVGEGQPLVAREAGADLLQLVDLDLAQRSWIKQAAARAWRSPRPGVTAYSWLNLSQKESLMLAPVVDQTEAQGSGPVHSSPRRLHSGDDRK